MNSRCSIFHAFWAMTDSIHGWKYFTPWVNTDTCRWFSQKAESNRLSFTTSSCILCVPDRRWLLIIPANCVDGVVYSICPLIMKLRRILSSLCDHHLQVFVFVLGVKCCIFVVRDCLSSCIFFFFFPFEKVFRFFFFFLLLAVSSGKPSEASCLGEFVAATSETGRRGFLYLLGGAHGVRWGKTWKIPATIDATGWGWGGGVPVRELTFEWSWRIFGYTAW